MNLEKWKKTNFDLKRTHCDAQQSERKLPSSVWVVWQTATPSKPSQVRHFHWFGTFRTLRVVFCHHYQMWPRRPHACKQMFSPMLDQASVDLGWLLTHVNNHYPYSRVWHTIQGLFSCLRLLPYHRLSPRGTERHEQIWVVRKRWFASPNLMTIR